MGDPDIFTYLEPPHPNNHYHLQMSLLPYDVEA